MDEATLRAMMAFVEAVDNYVYMHENQAMSSKSGKELRKACDKLGDMLEAEIEKKLN